MSTYKYRITLYNTKFFTEILTYKFPLLPSVGDMIEVINHRIMFVVESRSFHPHYVAGLIDVTLHGNFENSVDMGQHTFDKIRNEILNEKERLSTMDWNYDNKTVPPTLD